MKEQTVSLGTKIVAANEKLTSITMIDLYEMIPRTITQKSDRSPAQYPAHGQRKIQPDEKITPLLCLCPF